MEGIDLNLPSISDSILTTRLGINNVSGTPQSFNIKLNNSSKRVFLCVAALKTLLTVLYNK